MTLILGLGNELLGDEGIGVHAVRAIQELPWADGTEVLDVGTAILDFLPWLEKAQRVIIIDALKAEGNPGSVYRIPLDECSGQPCIASMHGFDIFRVVALTKRQVPPETIVFGVEPACIDWSLELSTTVAKALPPLLEAVRQELENGPKAN